MVARTPLAQAASRPVPIVSPHASIPSPNLREVTSSLAARFGSCSRTGPLSSRSRTASLP
eukprot:scaffold133722_cov26-Tisochrysis_lutea.AAC.7